jgi:hypothetical protein
MGSAPARAGVIANYALGSRPVVFHVTGPAEPTLVT